MAETPNTVITIPLRALSIKQFCLAHGISRSSWYALIRRGEAPAHFNIGSKVFISVEAANDWLAAHSNRGHDTTHAV